MGNNTYFYFGAYLRVVTVSEITQQNKWTCVNHGDVMAYRDGEFCRYCGSALERVPDKREFPSWGDIEYSLDEVFHEEMSELTHVGMKDGVILLRGNLNDDGESWLHLSANKYDTVEEKVVAFPNESEIQSMVDSLRENHKELIQEIKTHPRVSAVLYGCGFVEDSEI